MKLKQYTEKYRGLDAAHYLDGSQNIVGIITNRDVGKTTNIIGELLTRNDDFALLSRYKTGIPGLVASIENAAFFYNFPDYKAEMEVLDGIGVIKGPKGNNIFIISINDMQAVKLFGWAKYKVKVLFMDEALLLSGQYIRKFENENYEIDSIKWILGSLEKSGESVKFIFTGNFVSCINPYFNSIRDSNELTLFDNVVANMDLKTGNINNFSVETESVTFVFNNSIEHDKGSFSHSNQMDGILKDVYSNVVFDAKVKMQQVFKGGGLILSIGNYSDYYYSGRVVYVNTTNEKSKFDKLLFDRILKKYRLVKFLNVKAKAKFMKYSKDLKYLTGNLY